MLMPYIKRMVNSAHSRGLSYEIHMCGECSMLIPLFIESGADMWMGQDNLNDLVGYARQYKDSKFIFGVPAPAIPKGADDATVRKCAKDFVDQVKDLHVALFNMGTELPPNFNNYVYEYSRIAYQNEPELK
jgi:hypothetical protein